MWPPSESGQQADHLPARQIHLIAANNKNCQREESFITVKEWEQELGLIRRRFYIPEIHSKESEVPEAGLMTHNNHKNHVHREDPQGEAPVFYVSS